MGTKTISARTGAGTTDDLPGLAESRQAERGALGLVPGVGRGDAGLQQLRLEGQCQGGYCEMCPMSVQNQCESQR